MSKISLQPNASGTATFTIEAPATNTDRVLELPDEAGKVLTDVSDIEPQVKTATNASGAAPVYACRAWVNFNGTGTVSIRASGNVSSITDNGTGDYTVNFTTALPDANYVMSGACVNTGSTNNATVQYRADGSYNSPGSITLKNANQCRISAQGANGTRYDLPDINAVFFR